VRRDALLDSPALPSSIMGHPHRRWLLAMALAGLAPGASAALDIAADVRCVDSPYKQQVLQRDLNVYKAGLGDDRHYRGDRDTKQGSGVFRKHDENAGILAVAHRAPVRLACRLVLPQFTQCQCPGKSLGNRGDGEHDVVPERTLHRLRTLQPKVTVCD
jgi:hypothetical protein